MYKEIQIGEKTIGLKATASTTYRFKQVFKRDILKVMMDTSGAQQAEEDDVMRLAYIMAMSARGEDMGKLNEDSYIGWLDQFDPMDLFIAQEDIMEVFQGNRKTEETQKKTTTDGATDDNGTLPTAGDADGASDQ